MDVKCCPRKELKLKGRVNRNAHGERKTNRIRGRIYADGLTLTTPPRK